MRGILGTIILLCGFIAVWSLEIEFEYDPFGEEPLPSAISKAVKEAFEMNEKGLEALNKKDYDIALAYFDQALSIIPDYSDAVNNRGVVFFRKGIVSDAQKIWEILASKEPDYAIASYNLGLIQLHEKNLEASKRLFERALKADPKFVEALVRLGMVNLKLGKNEDALENLRKAYKMSPKYKDAWGFYAHGLIVNGDTSRATGILDKNNKDADALKMLGQIEAARKNNQKASEYFSSAVSRGADPSLLIELASVQLDDRKCKDALSTLKRYFSVKTKHVADAYILAGVASKECNDNTGALHYFEEGLKNHPNDPILKYNLGQIYFQQKKFDQAESMWEGMSDSLQDPSFFHIRALNARRRNDLKGAEKLILRAIEMDNRAVYHDFLGVIYHLQKDDKKAEAQFRKALKINPELRSAQLNLALSSRKGEDLDAAAGDLEKRLTSCSSDSCADLAFQLSIIYYHQKNLKKAVAALETVKDNEKDERIYRHLAIFYKEMHDLKKAVSSLETALNRFVVEVQTEYELAELYLLSGNYDKAINRFNAILPKWKENPWRLHYQLGYAYMEKNTLDRAVECFENSIKSKYDNVAARGLLAFVLNRKGNVTEARSLWEKNLKDDPSNPIIWINMGLSLENEEKYEQALEHYKKAAALKHNDKELQINVGNAYAGLDRYTDALHSYNLALSSGKRELAAYNIFLLAMKKKDQGKLQEMHKLLKKEFPASDYTKRVSSEMNLMKGDTASALKDLQSVSTKESADWLSMAKIYASRGDGEKCRLYLQKLPLETQWIKASNAVKAELAFKEGNYDLAINLLKESGDTGFAAKYNIALAAYNAKKYAEVLNMMSRLSSEASGKDRADCARLAGNAAFALKQWEKARSWYNQLSSIEANSSVVQYNLAVASYNLDDMDKAWKYYEKARKLDPKLKNKDIEKKYKMSKGIGTDSVQVMDSTDIWYNKAVELQNAGDDTAAEKLYKKILQKDSLHSLAWNNLGALYGVRGDIDNAENSYTKAIEKRYDIPEAYANLVNLYIELEEFTKARKWIIKGMGHNPGSELLEGLREKIAQAEIEAEQRVQNEQSDQ